MEWTLEERFHDKFYTLKSELEPNAVTSPAELTEYYRKIADKYNSIENVSELIACMGLQTGELVTFGYLNGDNQGYPIDGEYFIYVTSNPDRFNWHCDETSEEVTDEYGSNWEKILYLTSQLVLTKIEMKHPIKFYSDDEPYEEANPHMKAEWG